MIMGNAPVERQSNIELLRIVSMAAIVMLHIGAASVGLPEPKGNLQAVTMRDVWVLVVEAFSIIGVNCFALISGYFGIKARWSSFARLTLLCVVYAVGIYTLLAAFGLVPWSWVSWVQSWMVYSHTDLWYVPAYLGVFLLSPLLNHTGFNKWMLAAFVAFNVWCGWLWHGSFNPTGYTVMQLVMMYLIGRYIRNNIDISIRRKRVRCLAAAAYLACTALIVVMALFTDSLFAYAYNSPLVLCSSVSLFMFFASLEFRSRIVNRLAATAFAVYLVHKNPYIFGGILKPLSRQMWETTGLVGYTLWFIAFTVAIYLVIFVIDSARAALLSQLATAFHRLRGQKA